MKTSPFFVFSRDEILILSDKYINFKDVALENDGRPVELDLGCGSGDFAVALSARHPERTVLAADVMLGRLRKVWKKARRNGIGNLHFLRVEARHLVSVILPDSSVDRLHILCPDPWPKTKHRANRLLSSDFMMQIHRVLKSDGVFHFATDDAPYMQMVTENLEGSGLFDRAPDERIADIADLKTEFERQWLNAGKTVPHTAWSPRGIKFENPLSHA